MKLYEYIIRRLILMIFVLFALSVIVFYLTRGILPATFALAPYITPKMDDPAKLGLAVGLGVATKSCPSWTALTHQSPGCIVPLYQQYFSWLENALKGNWGYSLLQDIGAGQTTLGLFSSRFPATAELAIAGAVLTIVIALPMGIISATKNNKLPDHVSRIIALTGYSMPVFWLAFILQIVFVLYVRVHNTGVLPSNGLVSTTCGLCVANVGVVKTITGAPLFDALISGNPAYFWDALVALALPATTLSFSTLGALTRIVRSSMMDCLRQDYILLARSKGLLERTVIYRHALKNALLPAITISGLIVASLLGGVIVVEYVFSWPGIGVAVLSASLYVDINFLELYTLITALIIVLSNLVVDVLYAMLDPRIRY
jgi:dipeptide transport system permease protein